MMHFRRADHIALPVPSLFRSQPFHIAGGLVKHFLHIGLLIASVSAFAEEPSTPGQPTGLASDQESTPARPIVLAGTRVLTSHGLLVQLQGYMRQRDVDANKLSADAMVRLMVDWFRFAPIHAVGGPASTDALVFRYGGWSEGCATAFKLSLLRQVTPKNASDRETDLLAGITLMFEPSGRAELMPFTTVSSDWKSIGAFLEAVESTPAFRGLAATTPMSVLVESGGLR
jgi:hypothetical protein